MNAVIKFFAYILSLIIALPGIIFSGGETINDYEFSIDASQQGEVLPNAVSNINIWNAYESTEFSNPQINEEYDITDFVEYVQLMQCTGGNASRDLFVDPYNFEVLDDYDFSKLIVNCKGIVSMGMKPHLKLGSVPLKYSAKANIGADFGTNIYPPDDYDVYYNYMTAMEQALVDEFGAEEVLTWRFGVMTEYENTQWFISPDGSPEKTAEAYCKLYDYTVDALQKTIGENVFVGAHSMTVTEGLWDEKIFSEHCANGTNYKTGKTGTRICFLSASFYDFAPGEFTKGKPLPETIGYLKECAENAGLENLIYGIDEGRILCGNTSGADDSQLLSRVVGYTYQAAYDARLYKQLFDSDGDYFSSWSYLSGGLFNGNPTVSWHVAENIALFKGLKRIRTENTKKGVLYDTEVDAVSAYDDANKTIRIMAYNFKNEVEYDKTADLKFNINLPQFNGKKVKVKTYVIDDNCNYFDEWIEDRKTYGIGDDCFGWSPEDPQIESYTTLKNEDARNIYFTKLRSKYADCSRLVPEEKTYTVENSALTLETNLAPNGVVFYEITPCE